LFSLSDSLSVVEDKHPDLLVPVTEGTMIVASDYSGQHKEATHEAYSFLIVTDSALAEWLPILGIFRERWLPDGRRMSFKKLNESVRWRALPAFLETVGSLRGNLSPFSLTGGWAVLWRVDRVQLWKHFQIASPCPLVKAQWRKCSASPASSR
jgi:hypothetical protein